MVLLRLVFVVHSKEIKKMARKNNKCGSGGCLGPKECPLMLRGEVCKHMLNTEFANNNEARMTAAQTVVYLKKEGRDMFIVMLYDLKGDNGVKGNTAENLKPISVQALAIAIETNVLNCGDGRKYPIKNTQPLLRMLR